MKPQTTVDTIIKGPQIYCEDRVLTNTMLAIQNSKISAIATNIENKCSNTLEFPNNWHLIPGMIDMHIHGAAGADVLDGTTVALQKISQALAREGVTGFLASTVIGSNTQIEQALTAAKQFATQQDSSGAHLLGVNLEGPFISSKKIGAQNPGYLHAPDLSLFNHWQKLSGNLIKITTIAPEEPNALELIQNLTKQNIVIAFGHSDANYEQGIAAIKAGCTHVTHLFNAMRGIDHRAPNAITALLLENKVCVELIADNIHLHPAILALTFKIKGADKIILVSDAMRAKGLPDGNYEFCGQNTIVKDQVARQASGTLAGSTLTMNQAVKNMLHATGCSLTDICKMTATNPAKQLQIDTNKGSIAIAKDADLVVLDDKLNVRLTMITGKIIYS